MLNFTFNTGRLYAPEGQIVTAAYDPEACVAYFTDHTRMVSGKFSLSAGSRYDAWCDNPAIFARSVMAHYDSGNYEASVHPTKRQDAVLDIPA